MGIAALVLGIIAILSSVVGGAFSLGWVGSLCGILAIIFGAIGKKGPDKGSAKAGLILGIISLTWGIIATVLCATCLVGTAAGLSSLNF